jgi:hypothetical protein
MRPYSELPELAELILEESFVLAVEATPGSVMFEMDFVLTPQHPQYAPPPASERECFRRGTLRLTGVTQLQWDEQGAAPATDATGEKDLGHIDSFQWESKRLVFEGDWGRLAVVGDGVEVSLRSD